MPATIGMKGGGFYDDHSAPQMAAVAVVVPWLAEAIRQMDLPGPDRPFVIADFGCSEGRNSITAARSIIGAVRAKDRRPIQTIHADLPTNNFNRLFSNLDRAEKPVFPFSDVYTAAVGGSMYDQLLPPDTVNVATTYNAIGWLDDRPAVPVPDFILPMGPGRPRPGVGVTEEARQAFASQARADLVRFYRARAAELVPGGKLLIASFGAGERARACDGLYDALNDAFLDLVSAGRLKREAYAQVLVPVYFRTVSELVGPITDASTGLAEQFRVDRAETMEVPVPFVERFNTTGDAGAYAVDYTAFIRAFSEPVIRLGLAQEPAVDRIIAELYAHVERRLAEDPRGYAPRYVQVAALMTRL